MTVHQLVIQDEDQETVEIIEDLLGKAKRGEIRDFVVVCSVKDEESNGYLRHCQFNDRWRLLGAIEYAKDSVLKG
jgi:hypothetical protein